MHNSNFFIANRYKSGEEIKIPLSDICEVRYQLEFGKENEHAIVFLWEIDNKPHPLLDKTGKLLINFEQAQELQKIHIEILNAKNNS